MLKNQNECGSSPVSQPLVETNTLADPLISNWMRKFKGPMRSIVVEVVVSQNDENPPNL
jgi:hypothetical protein